MRCAARRRSQDAVDDHLHTAGGRGLARDRSGLLAAQEPRPGAGVRAVLRHRACGVPGGGRGAVYGGAAIGGGSDPVGARAIAQHTGFQSRAVCQRSAVCGVIAAVGGTRRGIPHGTARTLRSAARVGADGAAFADRVACRAVQGRSGGGRAGLRAAGLDRDRRTTTPRSGLSGVGRFALCATGTRRNHPPCRRARAPVRPAAGARRCQALLVGRRRGRQAHPRGGRVAGRASGTRLDHAAISRATSVAGADRAGPTGRGGRCGGRGARCGRGRGRRGVGSGWRRGLVRPCEQ